MNPVRSLVPTILILSLWAPNIFAQQQRPDIRTLDSLAYTHRLRFPSATNPTRPSLANVTTKLLPVGKGASVKEQNTLRVALPATLARDAAACHDTSGRYFVMENGLTYYVESGVRAKDGNVLISGVCWHTIDGTQDRGFLMKCNDTGLVIWTKLYHSVGETHTSSIEYYRMLELQDGSIMLAGRTDNVETLGNDVILTHTTSTGDVIWSKTYIPRKWAPTGAGSGDDFYLAQIIQDPGSGDLFLNAERWIDGYNITRIRTSNGGVLWSRFYKNGFGALTDYPFGLDVDGNRIVSFSKFLSSAGTAVISIFNINKANGDTISTKYLETVDPSNFNLGFLITDELVKLDNGHYAITGALYKYAYFSGFDTLGDLYHAAMAEFDNSGNFVRAYCFRNRHESNVENTKIRVFPDGSGFFSMLNRQSGFVSDAYYIQFRDGQILHQRKKHYVNEGMPQENYSIRSALGGDLIVKLLTDSTSGPSKIEFLNLHLSDTGSNCLGWNDQSTVVTPFQYQPISGHISWIGDDDLGESRNKTITAITTNPFRLPACRQLSLCDSIAVLISSNTVCMGSSVVLTIRKNAECGTQPFLQFDNNKLQFMQQLSDSTFLFNSIAAGKTKIYASITGCAVITDSVELTISHAPGAVDIGRDTLICTGNRILLRAGWGYRSYKWQDGSTDSVYMVSMPGNYFVAVTDSCGNMYFDTVLVNLRNPKPFSVGPDIVMCKNNTSSLTASSGFNHYAWSPRYRISDTSAASVQIFPLKDTSYVVTAEEEYGCFVFDTVRVTLRQAPEIYLGPDATLCSGDSITVDAGAGFDSYQWNNGSSSQRLTLSTQGRYIVTGYSAGCRSYDTIDLSVNAVPVPDLGSDPVICEGSSRVLDAGAYSYYVWSTGSSERKISIKATGTYFVKVTDSHGCEGTDTLVINKKMEPPSDFLPPDTIICNNSEWTLLPKSRFKTYTWSDLSTAPSINVSSAGNYWLEVRDEHNCLGRDTVSVAIRECLKGFYIPNAFAPHSSVEKNARFKPMIFGNVNKYEFTIYNRWGQTVFKTKDLSQSWDGSCHGEPQNNDTFVWSCSYQLMGEQMKNEKGTVVLIR